MNNATLAPAIPLDLPTLALILSIFASAGVLIEAYFMYKLYGAEQATYGLERKRFLSNRNVNMVGSSAFK
jgi:hypothetical protein